MRNILTLALSAFLLGVVSLTAPAGASERYGKQKVVYHILDSRTKCNAV
jgi:hypothetical protein